MIHDFTIMIKTDLSHITRGSFLVTMATVTPSPLVSPSEKAPKIYFQGQDFEMNFIPHIVLAIFTIDGSDFYLMNEYLIITILSQFSAW